MDWTTLALATTSGLARGLYPIFLKTDAVLAATPHPIVFQLYKSMVVLVVGCLLTLARSIQRESPIYEFSWWSVGSATAWIPAAVTTIIAVPLIGCASAAMITAAVGSSVSFFAFWLLFDEKMKTHTFGSSQVVLAPLYLFGCVVGMLGLIYMSELSQRTPRLAGSEIEIAPLTQSTQENNSDAEEFITEIGNSNHAELVLADKGWLPKAETLYGYVCAAATGLLTSVQFGVVQYGRQISPERQDDECFNALGSWQTTFGVAAMTETLLIYVGITMHAQCKVSAHPKMNWDVLAIPGLLSGLLWSVANICGVLAVVRGGNAVVMAQIKASALIVSGLVGLVWYQELRGWPAIGWTMIAAFTAFMIIMLGLEKVHK